MTFLYGRAVCEGHVRKGDIPRLVLDVNVHDEHVPDVFVEGEKKDHNTEKRREPDVALVATEV